MARPFIDAPVRWLPHLQDAFDYLLELIASSAGGGPHTHVIADVTGLQAALDGKEASGTAAAAVAAHEAAGDPHPQYLTPAEGDVAYEPLGAVATHAAAADPHPGYQRESEKNAANGYAGLSAGSKLAGAQQTYGSAANTACEGNDARLTDSRAPSGSAGGDLAGSYPNPTVTQARGLRETTGPTTLVMGAVADGEFLKRSGATLIGGTPAGGVADGDKGDITVSASGATWTIDAQAVTPAKTQNVSASSRILARKTAGAGSYEEATISEILDFLTGAANGDIIVRSGGSWVRLAKGTAGQVLLMDSTAATPGYGSVIGSYRTLLDSSGSHIAARVAGTYGFGQGDPLAITGTGTLYPLNTIALLSTDYPTMNGVAAKLRVRAQLYVNDVAPTGNFTFGLHPITRPATSGGAGLVIYTIGAAVAGSTIAVNTPAADSSNIALGSDFALPADGHYVLGCVTTAAVAASSHLHMSASLQIRNA